MSDHHSFGSSFTSAVNPFAGAENVPGDGHRRHTSSGLPMQETVPSASVLPPKPPPFQPTRASAQSALPHAASKQYIEQHRAFVEHHRKLHEEERGLWNLERQELHQKIRNLEATIQKLRTRSESDSTSPLGVIQARGSTSGSFPTPKSTSRGTSAERVQDEVWLGEGARSDVKPTRTFSDTSSAPHATGSTSSRQLPSITEEQHVPQRPAGGRTKSVGFSVAEPPPPPETQATKPVPIPGSKAHPNFDGITFRAPGAHSIWTPDSASRSPHRSPSPGTLSPGAPAPQPPPDAQPRPQLLDLPASELTPADLLTKDAGHTPLSRAVGSDCGSSVETPTARVLPAGERPAAPRPSVAPKPPSDRAEGYFPFVPGADEPLDEDPPLKGPLSLNSDLSAMRNRSFLEQVDSKLRQAKGMEGVMEGMEASPEDSGDAPTDGGGGDSAHSWEEIRDGNDPAAHDDDDGGPKLRIKRSLNFGSQLGARTLGDKA